MELRREKNRVVELTNETKKVKELQKVPRSCNLLSMLLGIMGCYRSDYGNRACTYVHV